MTGPDLPPVTISHVPDFYNRYPGESVTFYTRVDATVALPAFTLRIFVPDGLTVTDQRWVGTDFAVPHTELGDDGIFLVWSGNEPTSAGRRHEYEFSAVVDRTLYNLELESRAWLQTTLQDELVSVSESVTVAVAAKGRYLRYLPALFEDDELMGRFLMLFESFWAPIESQIDNIPLYFDPLMSPAELLPWLATWTDLLLDERWPEERKRRLILAAVPLFRRRGTKAGLEEFLEIYTGEKPQIIEHRAQNFRLGTTNTLGAGVALGNDNVPHTFTVILKLPPLPSQNGRNGAYARSLVQQRRTIESIIDSSKPAHTRYTLRIEELHPLMPEAEVDPAAIIAASQQGTQDRIGSDN